MENRTISPNRKIMHSLDDTDRKKKSGLFGKSTNLVSILLILALGIGSGFLIAQITIATGVTSKPVQVNELSEDAQIEKGLIVGADDKRQFPDEAEGVLEEGGIEGEGTHHLVRPGGESQSVYLTSSNVDLGRFVGRTVKVNGKTFDAEKAGWLMDVGQLEVLK